ncbi:MAG: zf-TFIIB domain-containing protein [Candidatus Eremiobacteraeota bacterium]|nr:zf-TFIIB domain-containing protein [Candidatus Eremiobacteraeota bacterium]
MEKIEVDPCFYCGGLWLDRGELAAFIRKGKIPRRLVSTFCLDMRKMKMMDGERNCSRCDVQFKLLDYGGVLIDFCPECEGFWFDRGELLKILQSYQFSEGLLNKSHPVVKELLSGGTKQDVASALPNEAFKQKVNLKFLSSGRPKTAAKIQESAEVIKAPEFIEEKVESIGVEHKIETDKEKSREYDRKIEEHKVFGVVAAEFIIGLFPFLFRDIKK